MKKTYKELILDKFIKGDSITEAQSSKWWHCHCLAQRMHELRGKGLNVKSDIRHTKDGVHYAAYYITKTERKVAKRILKQIGGRK